MHSDILGTLADLDYGEVVVQATQSLRAVVAEVRKTGAQGSVSLKITITRVDSDAGTVALVCAVIAKVITDWSPDEKPKPTVLFLDEDGNLRIANPRQPKLPGTDKTTVELTLPDGTTTGPVTLDALKPTTA